MGGTEIVRQDECRPENPSLCLCPGHLFTHSFVHTMRHLLVEMCITKSKGIHNIYTVCHGVAIHHRFNHRNSLLPNFAMTSIDFASFSQIVDLISVLRLSEPSFGQILHEVFAAMALVEISGESNFFTRYLH